MSGPARSGLFLYAKDLQRVARFYESVLGMRRLNESADLIVLDSEGTQLVVHEIPRDIAATITITSPPHKRENTALKFFFTVPSIEGARSTASALGGEVYAERWNGPGFVVCNACDPEGNIFQVRESVPMAGQNGDRQ